MKMLSANKYHWTNHVFQKMRYYKISPSRVRQIIKAPNRVEESIVPGTIAAMKKFSKNAKEEFWVMYKVQGPDVRSQKSEVQNSRIQHPTSNPSPPIVIITAWRYPGKSPKRNPIPPNILQEVRNILQNLPLI